MGGEIFPHFGRQFTHLVGSIKDTKPREPTRVLGTTSGLTGGKTECVLTDELLLVALLGIHSNLARNIRVRKGREMFPPALVPVWKTLEYFI